MLFYGWYITIACSIVNLFVAGVLFYGFTAFIEPLVNEFGWSYTSVSFAASLRGVEMGIFAPFVGMVVNRFGPKKLMLLGVLLIGAGLILLSFIKSRLMLYVAFMMISFGGGGCIVVVTPKLVSNWFERKIGKAMGLMVSGFGASGLIVPVIVWLISSYGWRTAATIMGIGIWLTCIPLIAVIFNTPEECGYFPDGIQPHENSLKSQSNSFQSADYNQDLSNFSLRSIISSRSFLILNIVEIIRMAVLAAVTTHIMPYLCNIGISRVVAGFIAAAIPLLSILGRFGFGWLSDVMTKKHVIGIAYAMMGLGTLFLSHVQDLTSIYTFLTFFSIGYGGVTVLRNVILHEYYGKFYFGRLIGILLGISSLGGIVGPTVAGWSFDFTGSYVSIWWIFCGLLSMSVIFIFVFMPSMKKEMKFPS